MMLDPKPPCISAIQEARSFLMGCRLHKTVLGEQIIGFPEIKGKERITEWGGTSSAIAVLLADIQYNPLEEITDINRAVEWLISRQTNGAWEASGMPCAEATAGVAFDLLLVGKLSAIAQDNAVNFLGDAIETAILFRIQITSDNHISILPTLLQNFSLRLPWISRKMRFANG